jgi:GNAT superfamily N-acetyltransferase
VTATDSYTVSTDPERVDVDLVHRFLSRESYWARGVDRATVERSLRNSLVFGVYRGEEQVGFARVVTDRATFAWLADVFVLPEHRGQGLSKRLMRAVAGHPDLKGLRFFLLKTSDAHGLYHQFGFERPGDPERFLAIQRSPQELYGP